MRTSWVEGTVYILQNSSTTHLTFMNFIGCKSHLNLNKKCYEKKRENPQRCGDVIGLRTIFLGR